MSTRKRKTPKPPDKKPHPTTAYAAAVISGEIITGRLVRLACERHLRDLKDGYKRGFHFDEEKANHAIGFFPQFLRHNEGEYADKPFELSPHQTFIVGSLYGWIKANGYRRFRHCYWEEGKGGGKTPTASGCGIYGLTMDGEEGAEIYCGAVTRDQAGIAFRDCKHMAEKSTFADRLDITEHNIAYAATNSFIRPVSSEARSLDGKRVFMALIDEEHEHPSPIVIDKLTAGNKGRTQPLNIRTTNSGYDRTSVCWYEHEYSREVLEQIRDDDDWFSYICQLDTCKKCLAEGKTSPQDECNACDHYWEEKNWVKSNPNIGKSITWEYLRSEVAKARAMPTKALTVKRLNFCIWTESKSHWLNMDDWDACLYRGRLEELKGRRCYAGLDLADSNDTASLVLIFPPLEDDEPYLLLPFIWIPENMKSRTGQDRERFKLWVSQGAMISTPGDVIDYRYIMTTIGQCRLDYDLKVLAFDRWGASKIVTDLCDDYGFTLDEKEAERYSKPWLVRMGQGFASMSAPTKEFAKLVSEKKIAHFGNPAFRWQIGNVVIEQDGAGNQKIDKGKSTDKVDSPVAGVIGLEAAICNANQTGGSVYDQRDVRTLG